MNQSGQTTPTNIQFRNRDETENNRFQLSHKNQLRIDKDISFDGNIDKTNAEEFIFRIEYLEKYHNTTWSELQGEFHKLLKGDAKDWYWLLVQHKNIHSWEELKKELRAQYSSNRTEFYEGL